MILGYNTNGFGSHSLIQAIEVIGGIGYRSIGITVDHHALNPQAPNVDAELKTCAAALREAGLLPVIETGARFLLDPWRKHAPNLLDEKPELRARRVDFLCQCVDIARNVGAPVVSLWSGAAGDTAASARELDARLISGLNLVCDRALSAGVLLAFEPEPGMHITSMADFDRIAASFSHPAFRLTLDLGHAHLTEVSVEETITKYSQQIANVHVEGMRRPHHEHLAPWDSGYDVKGALAALDKVGYEGPATLELSRSGHNAVDVARRSYDYLTS